MMTSMERPFTREETKRRRRKYEKMQIPNDVVEEIMMKLPVKSLTRFQVVSKHWASLIRSSDFGERYIAYQKSKDPKLLFVCDDLHNHADRTPFIEMITLDKTNYVSLELEDEESRQFKGFLEISECCDGLVCIYSLNEAVQVINPATAVSTLLPLAQIQQLYIHNPDIIYAIFPQRDLISDPAPFGSFTRFGFGKDSVTGRYKLVWLYNKYTTSTSSKKKVRCEVFDLVENTWRFVTTTPLDHHNILDNQRPAFSNGSFYWLTGDEPNLTETKLIVFDIHTEKFQLIPTPPFITPDASPYHIDICNLNGRLCISELKGDCTQDFWWKVKDNTTWDKIFSIDLNITSTWFGGFTIRPLTPLAIHTDTNKVILSLNYHENLVAFDLDPHSTIYHLYFSGYYGLALPFFPSLLC